MPRRNRVTPFGQLIAAPSRGTLMGNRGRLHDDRQRIRRSFACKRWIICLLEFRGRHRTIMAPGRYTELFFLDEATALAAGHRPCAECQHARYILFRGIWAAANPDHISSSPPSADEMDRVLHAERLDDNRGKRTYLSAASELPSGVMVCGNEGLPYLVTEHRLLLWEPGGYSRSIPKPINAAFRVLTPKSIVQAIKHGYPVMIHQSAGTFGGQVRAPILFPDS
jgi:hypothetical protein